MTMTMTHGGDDGDVRNDDEDDNDYHGDDGTL